MDTNLQKYMSFVKTVDCGFNRLPARADFDSISEIHFLQLPR